MMEKYKPIIQCGKGGGAAVSRCPPCPSPLQLYAPPSVSSVCVI